MTTLGILGNESVTPTENKAEEVLVLEARVAEQDLEIAQEALTIQLFNIDSALESISTLEQLAPMEDSDAKILATESVASLLATSVEATKEPGFIAKIWAAIKKALETAKKFIIDLYNKVTKSADAKYKALSAKIATWREGKKGDTKSPEDKSKDKKGDDALENVSVEADKKIAVQIPVFNGLNAESSFAALVSVTTIGKVPSNATAVWALVSKSLDGFKSLLKAADEKTNFTDAMEKVLTVDNGMEQAMKVMESAKTESYTLSSGNVSSIAKVKPEVYAGVIKSIADSKDAENTKVDIEKLSEEIKNLATKALEDKKITEGQVKQILTGVTKLNSFATKIGSSTVKMQAMMITAFESMAQASMTAQS